MSRLVHERFPRSNRYNPDWVLARAGGGAVAVALTSVSMSYARFPLLRDGS